MSTIHILDHQTDNIIDFYSNKKKLFWDDEHIQNAESYRETFDFRTLYENSDSLKGRNRLLIPDEDDFFREFIISEVVKVDSEIEVFSSASYLEDLQKAKPLAPFDLEGVTSVAAVTEVLKDTGWQAGEVTYAGIQTIRYDNYRTPLSALKTIANTFELALRFRVDTNGNVIKGRYVDLIPKRGEWTGKEITSGKDLIGVERREKTDELVTALICLGPEGENGNRITLEVRDDEALERWGRGKKHLWDVYEPQSDDEEMTTARLRSLGRIELEKRVNAIVEYETDQASIESVFGLSHEKVRFRDTVRIKDTSYRPPLYIEAQVKEVRRSISDPSQKTFVLGDFIEYEEEDLRALFNNMREELSKRIAFKVGQDQLADYTYDKAVIDDKDSAIYTDSKNYAFTKAQEAEDNAKEHADNEYAPIKNEVEENKNVWNRSGIINEDGTLNTDRLFGELTDDQIKSAGKWNGIGTYIDAEGVYTGLVVANQITSGTINADNVSITNDKVLINQDGVTVKDADFLVEDSISGIKSSIVHKSNYIKDGSFDFMRVNWEESRPGAGVYLAIGTPSDVTGWTTVGSPRIVTSFGSSDPHSYALFGMKSALVNHDHYLQQAFLKPFNISTFTFSFHYARHSDYNEGGYPNIQVEYWNDVNDMVGSETYTFPVPGNTVRRESFTINPPSSTYLIYIKLRTQNTRYLVYDGVQCTEGDKPIPFIPDSALTYFTHGYSEAEEIKSRKIDALGVSSLNLLKANDDPRAYFSFRDEYRNRIGLMGYAHVNNDNLTIRNELGPEIVLDADIVRYTSPLFRIGGTVSGNQGLSRFEFWNSNFTTRWGRLGYFGSSDTILGIQNNVGSEVRIYGNFSVSGSKAAVVDTESYGTRKMYALETPDSRFVSYTEHVLEEGEHYIEIEPMFLETICPTDYFVVPHIQNAAEVVILERKEGKFRVWVQGHTAEVVFEVNGKRRGYEDVYMEESTGPSDEPEESEKEEEEA